MLLSAATCTGSAQDDGTTTIMNLIGENGNFTIISGYFNNSSLNTTLAGDEPHTVFVPKDDAFKNVSESTLEALMKDPAALEQMLLYHVTNGTLMAENLANVSNITTLQGSELPVNVTDERTFVGEAEVLQANLTADNGVVHVIDAVLIPPKAPSEEKDIIETATEDGNFTTLLTAIRAANLTDTLKGEGPYTVFTPTDEAFNALPNGTIESLLNDTDTLTKILLYHVASERLMAEDVVNITNIKTLQGSDIPVNVTEEGVFVGDAQIIMKDVNASNGVIHAIDVVLIPPEPAPEQNLTVLYNDTVNLTEENVKFRNASLNYTIANLTDFGALYATGLDFNAALAQNMTGNVTNMTNVPFVFKSIEGVENNNTTGEMWFVYINGEPAKEYFGINPVSYGDKLNFWYTTGKSGEALIENATYVINITIAEMMAKDTIIEAAQNQTRLATFVNATETANLTETLNGTEPYTVFIPSNEAFNELPVETRNKLMNNTTLLRNVLSYHVLSGKYVRKQLASMNTVNNIQGDALQIKMVGENITIQNAIVTQIIVVNNGVICIIDKVLIPPDSGLLSDGNQTDGNQTDGNQTDGNQTDGNQTDGNQTDGNQTEDQAGNWYFFSIPFKANNTSVDYLLSDVNYTSLIYYNASTRLFEDVSNIEPLKGYWINVPNGTEFNASEQFASVEKKQVTVPPSLQTYPGWNALGSPVNETISAEIAFTTIDSSYTKIVGPWVSGNNTTGHYQYVGYNGFNGTLGENQLGTEEFEVKPYEGYWVFVKEENLYA
ncbi:fasciclin domain-containing protein [Methanosarcina sp. WWM596]|uniref:fasciclin domain-containing protein n=1 Tax=Methanosarcina sp. WWM596 TaxID=1434103 RepID=UPI000B1425AD|nr:fasciclin domain-containing protein [Methanosarcina sp. WWM596]